MIVDVCWTGTLNLSLEPQQNAVGVPEDILWIFLIFAHLCDHLFIL